MFAAGPGAASAPLTAVTGAPFCHAPVYYQVICMVLRFARDVITLGLVDLVSGVDLS